MKKLIIILVSLIFLTSCVDITKRQKIVQEKYPNCKVEPATRLIQNQGYEFIVIDSVNQIIAVRFYPFSETKISDLRNIR